VNFGPVTPEFKRGKIYTLRRTAVWLRSLSGATARSTLRGCSPMYWVLWGERGDQYSVSVIR